MKCNMLIIYFAAIAGALAVGVAKQQETTSEPSSDRRTFYVSPRWTINEQCDLVCHIPTLWFWQCYKHVRTHREICTSLNNEHPQGCCDTFTTTTSPSTTPTSPPTVPTSPPTTPTSPPTVPTSPPTMPTFPPTMPTSPPTMPTSPPTRPTSPPTPPSSSTTPLPSSSSTTPGPNSHCETKPMCDPEPGCASDFRSICFLECYQFCGNPCGCRSHANGQCDYDVISGTCQSRQLECGSSTFPNFECGKVDAFYVDRGLVCKNMQARGNCSLSHTVFAVNVNGKEHVDSRGIRYQADHPDFYRDPHKIRNGYNASKFLNHVDRNLYGTFIRGNVKGNAVKQCVTYGIGIRENGRYELALRLVEPVDDESGKRLFNIELHNTLVVAELDIFPLVGQLNPLDLLINFVVWTDITGKRYIDIKGHPSKHFPGILKLDICIGKCSFCIGYPQDIGVAVISGFSVLRFLS